MSPITEPFYHNPEYSQQGLMERRSDGASSSNLLITGLVLAGAAALAWYYFGPDLVRYMKIRSM